MTSLLRRYLTNATYVRDWLQVLRLLLLHHLDGVTSIMVAGATRSKRLDFLVRLLELSQLLLIMTTHVAELARLAHLTIQQHAHVDVWLVAAEQARHGLALAPFTVRRSHE